MIRVILMFLSYFIALLVFVSAILGSFVLTFIVVRNLTDSAPLGVLASVMCGVCAVMAVGMTSQRLDTEGRR